MVIVTDVVREGYSWHLVGTGQGRCRTFHKAKDGPHNSTIQPKMSVVARLRNPRRDAMGRQANCFYSIILWN